MNPLPQFWEKNWQHRQRQIQGVLVGQKPRKQLQRLAPQRVNKMLPPRGERHNTDDLKNTKGQGGNNDNDDWFDGLEEEKPNVGGEEGRV